MKKNSLGKIAMEGGTPVRKTHLPYGRQWITSEDVACVTKILTGDLITTGPVVEDFENAVANYCGAPYGVAFSSGTAALHAMSYVCGFNNSAEVIVPSMTFAATANCVEYCGGKPVFVDIDSQTKTLSPVALEKSITARTKAVIAVDFRGHPADYDAICEVARSHKLKVVTDGAHSLGSKYKNQKTGALAEVDFCVFSFHPVKALTTGEGGMVVCKSEADFIKLKEFRSHGIAREKHRLPADAPPWFYEMNFLGFNYRLTDIQASLGLSQMGRLDSFIARRREIAKQYNVAFHNNPLLEIPFEASWAESAYHLYSVEINLDRLRVGRETIFRALHAENIGVMVHYIPIHSFPYYRQRVPKSLVLPNTEYHYARTISLPMFPKMNDQDVRDVVESLSRVLHYYKK